MIVKAIVNLVVSSTITGGNIFSDALHKIFFAKHIRARVSASKKNNEAPLIQCRELLHPWHLPLPFLLIFRAFATKRAERINDNNNDTGERHRHR